MTDTSLAERADASRRAAPMADVFSGGATRHLAALPCSHMMPRSGAASPGGARHPSELPAVLGGTDLGRERAQLAHLRAAQSGRGWNADDLPRALVSLLEP